MEKMAGNIRFHYLYRDSGNYKTFGFQDFANPNNLSLEEVKNRIVEKLISGEFFYPEASGIEKFEFHLYCDDYSWYEFDGIEFVAETKPETSVEDFIAGISKRPKL
ncbi:hypothetical protein SAMN05444280_1244 [Tangfeifania diversioriginum]|uniref:Uncharacterized protein n=1 Tax=Tangfeifania diversioriginum TaxID=1168035 RepID=A0A1M6KP88_9BACT|nr:hypothetical protein [Tangfeifania diversioriginum]SHJ60759.1 hypothetical protein SAMN05444280_1244 [Tangfeifania diversioriginum]